mmetsp:Transcript_9035/g.22623  ORF Transcript_9035/g.22623 Transcript_9035/m.22623 type:complete len:211 (-) Transcript_9035:9-641(-)
MGNTQCQPTCCAGEGDTVRGKDLVSEIRPEAKLTNLPAASRSDTVTAPQQVTSRDPPANNPEVTPIDTARTNVTAVPDTGTSTDPAPPQAVGGGGAQMASATGVTTPTPPAVPEAPPPPTAKEWTVVCDRQPKDALGIVIDTAKHDCGGFRVKTLKPSSLISRHNETNPEDVVEVNDYLLSVNGADRWASMRDVLQNDAVTQLSLKLKRL